VGQFEFVLKGRGFTVCGKARFCSWFWVARRFTAAIASLFSVPALAAEGMRLSN